MSTHNELIMRMIAYYKGDPKRIQHFLKVFQFAKLIGEMEELEEQSLHILETTAIVHDIGIKISEEKYGSSSGKYQEQEGPAPAKDMLKSLEYKESDIEKICYLISRHHTYTNIDSIEYQILVEADFLVNMYEDNLPKVNIEKAYIKIFKTESAKELCRQMFAL